MALLLGRDPIAHLGLCRSVGAGSVSHRPRGRGGAGRAVRGRLWGAARAAVDAAAERVADAPADAPREAREAVPARRMDRRELLRAEREALLQLPDLALV